MANEILLNCLILGPDVGRSFPVDILRGRTVGHLKRAIKDNKAPDLDHIAPDKLDLWKVSDLMHNVPEEYPLPLLTQHTCSSRIPFRAMRLSTHLERSSTVQKLQTRFSLNL